MLELTGIDVNKYSCCKKGTMRIISELPKLSDVPFNVLLNQPQIKDSS